MSRPDVERIRRNAQAVFGGAGETATLRTYVSATTGAAKFGAASTLHYAETIITGLFASNILGAPRPIEMQWPGGLTQAAELMVTTDRAIGAQDELVWRGSAYRAAGAAMPETLGGRAMWRSPLKLAAVTG